MVLGEVSEAPYALFGGRVAADGCAKWHPGVCEGEGEARERILCGFLYRAASCYRR